MKSTIIATLIFTSFISMAQSHEDCELFKYSDENSKQLTLPISITDPSKNEETFNQITDRVAGLYLDTVQNLGGLLLPEKNWTDKTENAFARKDGRIWKISMFGGLYKNPLITNDAFALVACHEMGHLIGGAPFKDYTTAMSVEGQADYWGSAVCLKKYFSEYPEEVTMPNGSAKLACDMKYAQDPEAKSICYRTALAALSLGNYFSSHSIKNNVSWVTPSTQKLDYTSQNHPEAQCRLDTYMAGSLCNIENNDHSFSERLMHDKLTTDFLCLNEKTGISEEKRPACWFNSRVNMAYESFEKTVKSKSIFGLKSGIISFGFRSHLEGTYRIKIVSKAGSNTEEFVTFDKSEHVKYFPVSSTMTFFDFNYKFTKKAKRDLQFDLIVEFMGEEIYKKDITIKAYANLLVP